jgi:hypothetical protein
LRLRQVGPAQVGNAGNARLHNLCAAGHAIRARLVDQLVQALGQGGILFALWAR